MRVGEIELLPIPDAVGLLAEYADAYPRVPPDAWAPYRCCTRSSRGRAGGCRAPRTSFAPEASPSWSRRAWGRRGCGTGPPSIEGELPEALSGLGIFRDEVDMVFLTRLHIDHIGWNTDLEGSVFFPRARYVVHGEALAFARTQEERPHIRRRILPLLDRLEKIDGDTHIAPGSRRSLRAATIRGTWRSVSTPEGEAMVIADVAVHPALLEEPGWLSGIGRIVMREGTIAWEEARCGAGTAHC